MPVVKFLLFPQKLPQNDGSKNYQHLTFVNTFLLSFTTFELKKKPLNFFITTFVWLYMFVRSHYR